MGRRIHSDCSPEVSPAGEQGADRWGLGTGVTGEPPLYTPPSPKPSIAGPGPTTINKATAALTLPQS